MVFVVLSNVTTTTFEPTITTTIFTTLKNATQSMMQPVVQSMRTNITNIIEEEDDSQTEVKLSYILGATTLMAVSSVILYVVLRRKERKMMIENQQYVIEPVIYPI